MNNYIQKLLKRIGEMMDGLLPFEKLESHVLEIKDLSGAKGAKDWNELYKTVCAFLNTEGGLIICGIRENEKEKNYQLKGFDSPNEDKIRAELTSGNHFTDDARNPLKLDHKNINLKLFNFRSQQVAVVNVHPFADDDKFVFYKKENNAYIREMTGDKKVTKAQLEAHQEYKRELEYARELQPIPDTTAEDLDLFKIQEIIKLMNEGGGPFLNIPDSINDAMPFLVDNYFIKNDEVTLLGMLTCGEKPFYHLDKKAEVDCFLESENKDLVVADKRYIKDTVLTLMEDSFNFVRRNVRVATNYENGGGTTPEYPISVIRETVNNAIAHRDYKSNRPVQVIIHPNKKLVIKNPGTFNRKMLIEIPNGDYTIRRIIPPKGLPESKNPKLANLLKNTQRIENRGIGMATLVREALENRIGMPYYNMDDDTIILNVPAGRVLNERLTSIFEIYGKFIYEQLQGFANNYYLRILGFIYEAEDKDTEDCATLLLTEDNDHHKIIKKLISCGLIEKHPESPPFHPIYQIHKRLRQLNYYDEIIELIGKEKFEKLDYPEKKILNAVYIISNYGHNNISDLDHMKQNIIPFLYHQDYHYYDASEYQRCINSTLNYTVDLIHGRHILNISDEEGLHFIDSK